MPMIYLSPSTQENNYYVNGGTEEEWMNQLADMMEPYLTASGIRYARNTPDMSASTSIIASNAGNYDLHLSLHSNAAPEGRYGQVRGIITFYFPGSVLGERVADLITEELKMIYPLPNLVRTQATTSLGEIRQVRAPSVLLELGFHDNEADATWIKYNLDPSAIQIVRALTEYFSLPFLTPKAPRSGVVDVTFGALNVRDRPNVTAIILAQAYDGAPITILNQWEDWYVVQLDGLVGWAHSDFITLV